MQGTNVSISELREWASQIFDSVERRGTKSVDLSGRHYWKFGSDEVWNAEPPEPLVGDLADDLEDIRFDLGSENDDFDRSLIAWHTLDHFIGVLGKLSADLKDHDFDGKLGSGV